MQNLSGQPAFDEASLKADIEARRASGETRVELSRRVAFALVRAGINPTVAKIRAITNLGSNDAIAQDLQAIRIEIGRLVEARASSFAVPAEFAGLAEQLVAQLWQGALVHASAGFDTERTLVEADRESAVEARRVLQSELEQSQVAGATLALELEAANRLVEVQRQQLDALAGHVALAKQQAHDMRSQLDAQALTHASEFGALTSEIDKLRVFHDKALAKSEGDRHFVMIQLDGARSAERDLREQLKRADGEKEVWEQRHRRDLNSLREAYGAAMLDAAESKATILPLREQLAAAHLRINSLEQRFDNRVASKPKTTDVARKQRVEASPLRKRRVGSLPTGVDSK